MSYARSITPRVGSLQAGFSLVELLVVLGLFAVMAGMVTVNLIRPQTAASITGMVDVLATNLRSQQFKAMVGDGSATGSAQSHGVYIQGNQYTLFKGSSYSAVDAENFVTTA